MGSKRSAGAAIVYKGDLYVFGGYDGNVCLQTSEVFQHKIQKWTCLSDMSFGRCASGAALNNLLYVVGGYSTPYPMVCESLVEAFNTRTKKWEITPPMLTARSRVAAVVANEELYAIGGCPAGEMFLNTVEKYDPNTRQWTEAPPMAYRRGYPAATVYGDNIFVCGGFVESLYLRAVEVYNTITQTWTEIAPMSAVRSAASAVEIQGHIYVLGGYDPHAKHNGHAGCIDRLDIVERLDPRENSWVTVTPMLTPRSHTMCVKYSCLTGFRTILTPAEVEAPPHNDDS